MNVSNSKLKCMLVHVYTCSIACLHLGSLCLHAKYIHVVHVAMLEVEYRVIDHNRVIGTGGSPVLYFTSMWCFALSQSPRGPLEPRQELQY